VPEGKAETERDGAARSLRVLIGCDHGGFELKQELLPFLRELGYTCTDVGTEDDSSSDYPDVAAAGARAVAEGEVDRAILICGTGAGMSIAANKVPGVYAVNCTEAYVARMTRLHNNANVLTLGGRVVGPELAKDIVQTWLETQFSGEARHARRVGKVKQIEDGCAERRDG
jgi:ribose 5-phosphate isomerase B